jgi:RES domain-containing protein
MPGAGSNDNIPVSRVACKTHRLINSKHPAVGIFDRVATPDQAKAAMLIEQLTNPRTTKVSERFAHIPAGELVLGKPGATFIMAAFIHTSEEGGRFNTEEMGAWYASFTVDTAIRETVYHQYSRLKQSRMNIHGTIIQLRELVSSLNTDLHDIRNVQGIRPELYDAQDYIQSQRFGASLRQAGSNGICFRSVRHAGGENVAVFKPSLLPPVIQGDHYQYEWYNDPEPVIRKLTSVG